MSNKTNFNPDGNLFVKGGLSSESYLDVTGNATFGGDVTITGALQASGNITFLNDTQTVNAADGYVINSDSDVANAYLQINSNVSNIRLSYNTNSATLGYSGETEQISLVANAITVDGVTSITGNTTLPDLNVTNELNVVNTTTIGGNLDITAGVVNLGTSPTSNTISNARFTGVANTADKWHTTRNIGVNLTGDVSGSGNVDIDGTGNVTVNVTTTTVGLDAVALGTDTTGNYVATLADAGNGNLVVSGSGTETAAVTIDLADKSGASAGTYGNATHHMVFELDSKGRVNNVAPVSANISSSQVHNFQSTVRSDVSASTGLSYNSSTGVFSITDTAVTAGLYGDANTVPQFNVNAQGQLIDASNVDIEIFARQISDFNANISTYIQNGTYVTEANGVLDVTADVVTTDRNDTLTADYVFTGNVDFSGASVTDANVAHLGGTETFTGDKTFSGDVTATSNVDLTGAVVTATTQANSDQTTKVATTQYVENRIAGVLGDAPAALDTLGEIANALVDDANIGNVLTASIANVESNTIFKQGNVAMSGDLDLGSNKIVSVADPTAAQDAATKAYTDNLVNTANNALKANVDVNKVDKDFEVQASYAFTLGTKLANGTIVTGDDSSLNNPNSANNAVSFYNTDETQNIFIGTKQYGHRYAVLHQGAQGSGELVPAQERSGNLLITGDVSFKRGIDSNASVGAEFNGAGTFTSISNMRHVKSANTAFAAVQSYSSNVNTIFYKDELGALSGNASESATLISGSNILVLTGNADTVDTYLGSETTGTLNAVATYSNVEVGVPRAHFQNFGKSTTFIGDFGNVSTYTNVFDLDTSSIYTTGGRPLERLTVDGAISLGSRHTPANLLVNGTIFYDSSTNKLKGVEGNSVVDIVGAITSAIDLGDGTGEYQLASASGNTTFMHQLTVGDGITDSINASNVISLAIDDSHVTSVARGAISANSSGLAYDNTTGEITHTLSTDNISEGSSLYYTDERVDDRVASLIVGGANVTATYDDAAGTLTLDADLAGDITGVIAGDGLTGGGTAGDVTLNVVGGTGITANANDIAITNTGVTAATYGTASQTPTFTVNAQGQLTAASQQAISITASQVSDFNEALEDRIGSGFIVGGSNITVTYDDAGNSFTIDADQSGDVESVIAGNGLTGGGSSGDLTLNVVGGDGITANADDIAVDSTVVRTTGAQSIAGEKTFSNNVVLGADLITGGNRITHASSGTVSFLDFTKTLFSETNHTVLSSVKSIDFFLDANGGDSGQAFRIFNNTNPDGSVTESNYIFKVSENGNVDITGNLTVSDAYTLPTSDGTNNQVLSTDGNGVISFTDVSAIGGTITGVTAGNGLSGGGVAGTVTLDLDFSELDDMTGTMDNTDEFIILDSGTGEKRKAANEIGLSVFNNDSGFTTNVGDITGVTAGFGLSGGGTTGTVSLALANADVRGLFSAGGDLSYNSSTGQFSFTNDAGDIESVTAGVGLSGGGTSGAVSLAVDLNELSSGTINVTSDRIPFIDATDNGTKKETVGNFIAAVAGTGLDATGGVLSTDSLGHFSTSDLSEGTNLYFSNARVQAVSINNVSEDTTPQLGGNLDVNGNNILFGDNEKAVFGDGPDLEIYHDGTDSYIDDVGEGSIFIRSGTTYFQNSSGTKTSIQTNSGAGQSFYFNNNKTLETVDGGAKVTGNLEVTGNFVTADTDNLSEGSTNLYYTVARANSAIDARVTNSFVDALNVDADTVDSLHASSFLRSDAADTHSGTITPNADNSIDLGSSSNRYNEVYAVTFQGTATSAQYADLAENYLGDAVYEVGTVVEFGGSAEVTASSRESSPAVAGVVSTDPAYLMNAGLEGDKITTVALRGRVPCKVYGPVRKGDVLIASEKPGLAKAAPFRGYQTPAACIVGKAISEHRGMAEGVVEILV